MVFPEIDFESEEPYWEAAVIDLDEGLAMALRVVKALRRLAEEKIEERAGRPSCKTGHTFCNSARSGSPQCAGQIARRSDAGCGTWRKRSTPPLSPYLQKAAVYSDEAGSEIIMAIDSKAPCRGSGSATTGEAQEKFARAARKGRVVDKPDRGGESGQQRAGIRIGVRIGEQPTARIVVDLVMRPIFSPASPSRCCCKSCPTTAR